tara:strand:+ start:178 stop:597 length:420 start_codon:yes stop_codon:yes gene_type:complete
MSRLPLILYFVGKFFLFIKLTPLSYITTLLNRIIFSIYLPSEAKIGKGCKFAYGGLGIVIHKKTVIGINCIIGTSVVIGGKSGHKNVPQIGDNVSIGAGAKILGPITIGNNVQIGANAVLISSVKDNIKVAGIPAKEIA